MSYIPTEWETGDVVTAEKLNKLENGVAGGSGGGGGGGSNLAVNVLYDETTGTASLDKTWKEIKDAVDAGGIVVATAYENEITEILYLTTIGDSGDGLYFCAFNTTEFSADDINGYPVFSQNDDAKPRDEQLEQEVS